MEKVPSNTRTDAFPAGLRVVVVDDDPTWLSILERMLKRCSCEGTITDLLRFIKDNYEFLNWIDAFQKDSNSSCGASEIVTTCCSARDVLALLRENRYGYDIVISDVIMPGMDEHLYRFTVISVDGERSRVMRGIQLGACEYLLKPIRMKELRNICQHVFRRKIQKEIDIESIEGTIQVQMAINGLDKSNGGHLLCGENLTSVKIGKEVQNKHDDKGPGGNFSTKKSAVIFHQKFDKAVNQIGPDSKENGIKCSDSASRDSTASIGTQYSCNWEYIALPNGTCGFSGNSTSLLRNMESTSYDGEEEISSTPVAYSKKSDFSDPSESKSSQTQYSHSSTSSGSGANSTAFDSTFLFRSKPDY
ncbi:two-component response regulator ORR26 [Ricinus communis]|uniref:two-component response regulator ORR26 n=1 Tax=Ricinus communis TaxID=3988 RepID=UPI000772A980|nr:two-component response regulator ORR26 [Ricinus communis]